MQELMTLIDKTRDWNKAYPHDQIKITIISASLSKNIIESYVNGINKEKPIENLLFEQEILREAGGDIERFYFIFKSEYTAQKDGIPNMQDKAGIKYENLEGRISEMRIILGIADRNLVIPTPTPNTNP